MFEIENMSDVDSAKRKKIDLAGCLGFFIKIFLFLESIPPTEVARWLEPSALDSLRALDLIRIGTFSSDSDSPVEMYYSTVWLYPVAGYLIASDRRNNPDGSEFAEIPDIVFPAIYDGTFRFLRIFSRRPAEDALELCSGSGIAALVLSRTVNRVVASDLTARAAHFAQFNRRLNHCMNVEIAQGDLYSAVEGRSFDRIVAHPPYVPAVSEALIYRDSGETGETLIRRIIAGLPDYLRPGGTFYSVCEGWDAKEGLFEERVRSWLGKRQREFDIIFALQRQLSPDEVAGQVVKLEHSSEDSKTVNWRELFRSAGLENRVYGALVLHRREAGTEADASSPPVTRRLRLGESTEGASFEWALRWYSWRNRKEASGNLAQSICRIRPRLSPNLQAKVTHAVQEGSLVPTDIVFETELPFPTASRIDLWMMQMLANFDGQLTTEAVYAAARKTLAIPESFGLKDFANLVTNMIERGCLDVENCVFES
jgi:SAM-dependent methyltransferase